VDALALLAGDAQVFGDQIWSSRVHLHRTDPRALVELLPLDAFDELLTGTAIRTPAVRVVRDGSVLASSSFTRSAAIAGHPVTGLVDARKVLDLFRDGATVVLQGLHRYWPPLTHLVRDLEVRLGHPCQANAYLTPPGSQGFARHHDTHDVFVVQTHGTKQWTVGDRDGEREVVLAPGTSLYLPTGTPHSARSQQANSLHVTIGVNRLTWRDAMLDVAREVLADRRFDAPLPAGYLDDPRRLAGPLADELAAFGKALAAGDADEIAHARTAAFLTRRPAVLGGAVSDAVAEIDDTTTLERRPGSICVLRRGAERLHVYLGDRELRVPSRLEPAMAFVRDRDSWQVCELPLDAQSRLVLARRLLREGLLRVAR
jgi:bifunctional lysine-specific demethylase and histidyl-hydroxylase NO66